MGVSLEWKTACAGRLAGNSDPDPLEINLTNYQMKRLTVREKECVERKRLGYFVGGTISISILIGAIVYTPVQGAEIPLGRVDIVEELSDEAEVVEGVEKPPRVSGKDVVSVSAKVVPCEHCYIVDWVDATVGGSPIDIQYVEALYRASGEDLYLTRLAVAIAFAETTLGTHPLVTQQTNFMGWDIWRGYDPETVEEFAEVYMNGLDKWYRGVESDRALAEVYTGKDRVETWTVAVNEALTQMENYR